MITAIVLVHVAADRIPEAAQAIADLDGVDEVYSCAGDVDLIAMVKVAQHEQLADVIALCGLVAVLSAAVFRARVADVMDQSRPMEKDSSASRRE